MALDIQLPEEKALPVNRESLLTKEMELRRPTKTSADLRYASTRLFIRTGRLLLALLFGIVAFYFFSWARGMLSTPFAQLSPIGLFEGLAVGVGGVCFALGAFWMGFGAGESREYFDARTEANLRREIELIAEAEPWRLRSLHLQDAKRLTLDPSESRRLFWSFWIVYAAVVVGLLAFVAAVRLN